ncbi:helix-turn-helix domain-containing protein [Streptomyces jumonjinensis]|uniref:Helix-turn-helix domain-containing protein n=1 Tax=Streptomyces jumonjinensis TaxID=1945 RepID=A0A646KM50_STRJU|nr:helix-turn-helix domain-containing protein [Streptomyces jumonjinensis]MQT03117.1 helix-turn-helix domain-containing protein [Streptomyces jumonjinensis]
METTDETPGEDFAQILKRLKDEYGIRSDSEIARRIDVSPATVNTWVHRKRRPRDEAIRALAAAFPRFSREELSAAAGRQAPGPLSPDAEQRIIELFRELTKDQQEFTETQLRALRDANRTR